MYQPNPQTDFHIHHYVHSVPDMSEVKRDNDENEYEWVPTGKYGRYKRVKKEVPNEQESD